MKELGEIFGEESFLNYDDEFDSWKYRDEIFRLTQLHLLKKSAQEWLSLFRERGIWVGEVYGYEDLLKDPQIAHNETFVTYEHPTEGLVKTPGFPYKFSVTPAQVYNGAPQIGEHTRDVLSSLGYSQLKIDELISSGNIYAMEDK